MNQNTFNNLIKIEEASSGDCELLNVVDNSDAELEYLKVTSEAQKIELKEREMAVEEDKQKLEREKFEHQKQEAEKKNKMEEEKLRLESEKFEFQKKESLSEKIWSRVKICFEGVTSLAVLGGVIVKGVQVFVQRKTMKEGYAIDQVASLTSQTAKTVFKDLISTKIH